MANRTRTQPGAEKITIPDEQEVLDNLQSKYEKNKKSINTAVTVILVVVVGYFAYTNLYQQPKNDKAAGAVAYAEKYFQADSLNLALNGDGQHQGFLKIIKKYDGTPTANISHYYAGVCYLRMGDFKNAIKHLEDFNGKGTIVEYAAWGALGDAYMESGNTKKGIESYEKAVKGKDNTMYNPVYLKRLGVANEIAKKPEDAKKAYTRLRDEYPMSEQARDMDKALARLGVIE